MVGDWATLCEDLWGERGTQQWQVGGPLSVFAITIQDTLRLKRLYPRG